MEDSSGQSLLFQSILLLILTLLTAFFSASEMALVSLNRSRVEQKAEEGDKKFIRLLKVLENPNNFLSTIQVGITFISLLQGASLSASLGAVIATWFGHAAWAKTAASSCPHPRCPFSEGPGTSCHAHRCPRCHS